MIQLCVATIDPTKIVSSLCDETAYSLQEVYLGSYQTTIEEQEALKSAPVSELTLGFVLDTEADFAPYVYTTYTADKRRKCRVYMGRTYSRERQLSRSLPFQARRKSLVHRIQWIRCGVPGNYCWAS